MIVVAGELTVGRWHVDAIKPYMRAMMAASRAEPGCLRFAYLQAADDPRMFYVGEGWETQAQLARHMRSDHWSEWRAVWPRFGVRLRHLTVAKLRTRRGAELLAVGVIPPDPPEYPDHTLTAAVRADEFRHEAHCLAHRRVHTFAAVAKAIDGAEHPARWCGECAASVRHHANSPLDGTMRAAVVWGMLDATSVPADAGIVAEARPRRGRPRSVD